MTAGERPRERMERCGARALSDAELLAIILRTGTPRNNVIDMARQVLALTGGKLCEFRNLGLESICRVDGMGKSKAMQVAAVMELARRMEEGSEDKTVDGPEDAFHCLSPLFTTGSLEECWCLFMKRNGKVLGSMMVSRGSETSTQINIKQIIRRGLELNASGIILSHNHPSGNPEPSMEDIKMTEQLNDAMESFEMHLMDHIIISEDSWYSFSQNGKFSSKCKKV